jgi:hypothetical protein
MDISALLAPMAKAAIKGKGNYMGEGTFIVLTKVVKKVEGVDAKTGMPKTSCVVEFEIEESDNPAHKPKSIGSWSVGLDKAQAFGDIKAFALAAALELDPNVVSDENAYAEEHEAATEFMKVALDKEYATAHPEYEATEMIGKRLKLFTKKVPTKAGGEFTKYRWSPAAPNPTAAS